MMHNGPDLEYTYLCTALDFSKHSKARRKQVGAVLVTKNDVMLPGYNGTPRGTDNNCEHENPDGSLVSKPEVIHAELNCILKAAREGVDVKGAAMYITLSPCLPCAAMMLQVGITKVVYLEDYRSTEGVDYLWNNHVFIQRRTL